VDEHGAPGKFKGKFKYKEKAGPSELGMTAKIKGKFKYEA
jgi:hypothetical protein